MTTDYKKVFQLAQDKGYKHRFEWDDPNTRTYEDPSDDTAIDDMPIKVNPDLCLCELTLIQKWLRDKHKIIVLIDCQQTDALYQYVIKWHNKVHLEQYGKGANTYEAELLNGINAALKLIP